MEHEKEESFVKVTLIYKPEDRDLMLFKRCIWVTMGKTEAPTAPPALPASAPRTPRKA